MPERTNQAWLDALRGPGREAALADLRTLLRRGLRCALSDVSQEHVEDFVQVALLKIVDHLDSFRGESRFTTWAHKIAIHEAFTELRRSRWKDVYLQDLVDQYDDGDFTPIILSHPAPSPEKVVTQQALFEMVLRLVDEALTERQRRAMLAMLAGMPLQEIARRMDTNRNALYKLLHDARQKLKQRLMAQGVSLEDVIGAFEEREGVRG